MKTNHTSYGIIPVYKNNGDIYVCCVRNAKGGHWGLPKGTPEEGEEPFETAIRELEEETGIKYIEVEGGLKFEEKYSFEQEGVIHYKTNKYYLGYVDEMVEDHVDLDSREIRWVRLEELEDFFDLDGVKGISRDLKQILN